MYAKAERIKEEEAQAASAPAAFNASQVGEAANQAKAEAAEEVQRKDEAALQSQKSQQAQVKLEASTAEDEAEAKRKEIEPKSLLQLLHFLVEQGRVYRIDGSYIHATAVNSCREKLLEALEARGEGITVAEFRDLVGGNRKICLLLLAQYDSEGLTERFGDRRRLAR